MSRMSSAQVGNAKKLNNYEPSKHFYQLIMDKCVSLLAVFLWGVFTSNVIVNSETPTEHLKWAQVVSCAHDGEDHCQQNNTCVDLLPAAHKNETANCWYSHRAAVKRLLNGCLDSQKISNINCWKSDGGGLLRQRFKSNSNSTSPFETALKCWFYDCLRLAACSEKCTAEKQADVDPKLSSCILESERKEIQQLMKCIANANRLTHQ